MKRKLFFFLFLFNFRACLQLQSVISPVRVRVREVLSFDWEGAYSFFVFFRMCLFAKVIIF